LFSRYIGKNKIKKIENLNLPKLEILSIQSNRITKLENLSHLVNLEELYISDNGLTCIEGLDSLKSLKVLDLSNNQIEHIENMQGMVNLEEFWFSNNNLKNWEDLEKLTQLSKLKCLYLEHNPIYYISNKKPSIIVVDSQVNSSDYRRKVVMTLPNLEQLDATPCKRPSLNTAPIL
jgi:protein phosphatase 1 regulatory subunit 7